MVTKYLPVVLLWTNSTAVRQTLGQIEAKGLVQTIIEINFQDQLAKHETSGYHGHKEPSSGPSLNQQYND